MPSPENNAPPRFRIRLADSDVVHNLTTDKLIIGSHVAVDICIKDRLASRRHAEVFVEDLRVIVRDLKSKNGTWFQSKPISIAYLDVGQFFRIGDMEFFVETLVTPSDAGTFLEDDIQTEREAFVRPANKRAGQSSPLIQTADRTEADVPAPSAPPPFSVAKREFERSYAKQSLAAALFDRDRAASVAGLSTVQFDELCARAGLTRSPTLTDANDESNASDDDNATIGDDVPSQEA